MEKELDTYHDYGKISRVITGIDILAWALLVISAALTLLYLIRSVPTLQATSLDAWLQFLAPLPQLLQGAFWFVVLNVFKEGLYLLLDIEENSRQGESMASSFLMTEPASAGYDDLDDDDQEDEEESEES